MPQRYIVREEPDRSCSVVQEGSHRPVALAGIPQTGLHPKDAKELAERLSRMASGPPTAQAVTH